ncbi:MAG: ferrous iron transporter B, partial [Paraclostridium sp.]
AKKKGIYIDKDKLEDELGIPVVLTAARNNVGIESLLNTIDTVTSNKYDYNNKLITYSEDIESKLSLIEEDLKEVIPYIKSRWLGLRLIDGDNSIYESMDSYIDGDYRSSINEIKAKLPIDIDKVSIRDNISNISYEYAKELYDKYVIIKDKSKFSRDEKIDKIITSKTFGIPLMLLCLGIVLWITIQGANYPSQMLSNLLFSFEPHIFNFFESINVPLWFNEMITYGMYRGLAWVISVMLPPMAIFFPLFTLMEDFGYLPRVAFNLDHMFKRACCHGKQCLTMCMGFGCNAAGVIGCRIIDSPRERLVAILTNNFVPCNGRFPTLIAVATIFFTSSIKSTFSANLLTSLCITLVIILGVIVTLLTSYLLSKTLLKGVPSTFTLELPPYRTPKFGRVLYSSIIDRTMFVLWRAIIVAAPAGIITWIFANVYIGDVSILSYVAGVLDPFAKTIGLDGFILMAFILGLPANEIVIPVLLMSYLSTGSMIELDNFAELGKVLRDNGWTYLTALNVMLFSLMHWPCATTLMTIKKETGSAKWTFVGFMLPTVIGILVCFLTTTVFRLLGLA